MRTDRSPIRAARQSTGYLRSKILRQFRTLHDRAPAWAWGFPPSIPFIGHKYKPGTGLLIYASAENLSWMHDSTVPWRYVGDAAWDRYRHAFEEEGRESSDFYPCVGIQPVTDGGLLAAGLFIAQRLGLPTHAEPRAFLETLAITNWCKYSVKSRNNSDYVRDKAKLMASIPFVKCELAALQPATVLLPNVLWRHEELAHAMRRASPHTRFLPAPQFNATVVNCRLSSYHAAATQLRMCADPTLSEWTVHLRRIHVPNAWRFLAWLEEFIISYFEADKPR